jgi:hypothetical protein
MKWRPRGRLQLETLETLLVAHEQASGERP